MEPKTRIRELPWATILYSVLAVVIGGYYLKNHAPLCQTIWALADPIELWQGKKWWAVFTCTLVHVSLPDLAVSVFLIAVLGAAVERTFGRKFWVWFFCCSCLVSQATCLAVEHGTGIGSSGICCAFFGLCLVRRGKVPEFANILSNKVVCLFLILLITLWLECWLRPTATYNSTHFVGLSFGVFCGAVPEGRVFKFATKATAIGLACSSVLVLAWCPWSSSWTCARAIIAYDRNYMDEAEAFAMKSWKQGQDPVWAWDFLAIVRSVKGDEVGLREALSELRKISPSAATAAEERIRKAKTSTAAIL